MAINIKQFIDLGITPFKDTFKEYASNHRNKNKYEIKFMRFEFDDDNERMTSYFKIKQYCLNADGVTYYLNDTYDKAIGCDMYTMINPETGAIVTRDEVTGEFPVGSIAEFTGFCVLFSAPIPDSLIVTSYKDELFDRGRFDKRD